MILLPVLNNSVDNTPHARQRQAQTLAGLLAGSEKGYLTTLHQNAQRLLRPLKVVNPYAEKLTFLSDKTRTQRTTLQPLQVWFRWLAKQNLILANPAADLELPWLEERLLLTILSVAQVEEIVNLCDLTTLQGMRDRALIELL